ncbi:MULTISPECIES: cell wall hydrolase [unclassified Stenotrophomonas]|jgi:spore germination cell wall hydrolase CwlJ-like protein|uniref:cell wall hydrolase n=1 Tax=unclassified Stenotrophomonas TaxID=196198 RepID=UPI001310992D|nr:MULTISPECIES: cell wall hydrolase [unclassified Stenotrophomonas]
MKLAWILWLSQLLPQPAADSLCLSTTVYLEARDQTLRGQQAVAEVALRRLDSGLWGDSMCKVVTARKQFAPTIVAPGTQLGNADAWQEAMTVAFDAERNWALPVGERKEIVPGASHFAALSIANPSWRNAYQVATIGDHTFYRVQKLKPRAS